MVAFLNTTTVDNAEAGEKLFESFAPGAGFGFRFLLNKRSRTNLCTDYGWGKAGRAASISPSRKRSNRIRSQSKHDQTQRSQRSRSFLGRSDKKLCDLRDLCV